MCLITMNINIVIVALVMEKIILVYFCKVAFVNTDRQTVRTIKKTKVYCTQYINKQ